MSNSKEAVALRVAASHWADGLHAPVTDSRDTASKHRDRALQRAAVRYGMTKPKRGYSRDFTPAHQGHKRYLLDKIPVPLWRDVQAKAKREGVSVRALILKLLQDWLKS